MPEKTRRSTDLLRQAVRARGLTLDELAGRALMPHATFFRRLGHPSNFTVGNLRDIYDALLLDADEALSITAALLWEGSEG